MIIFIRVVCTRACVPIYIVYLESFYTRVYNIIIITLSRHARTYTRLHYTIKIHNNACCTIDREDQRRRRISIL